MTNKWCGLKMDLFFKDFHRSMCQRCAHDVMILYKARKHLKRDFGLWVQASWRNPGHCSVKWVPVVSSECKGLCISLVCTAWSTLLLPFNHSAWIILWSVCFLENNLRHCLCMIRPLKQTLHYNANPVLRFISHHGLHFSMNLMIYSSASSR